MASRLRYNGKRIGGREIRRIPVLGDHCLRTQNTSLNFKMTVFKPSLSERGLHRERNTALRHFLQSARVFACSCRGPRCSRPLACNHERERNWEKRGAGTRLCAATMKLFSLARLLVSYLFAHHLSHDCGAQVASFTASRTGLRGFGVRRGIRSHPLVYELAFLSLGSVCVCLRWNPILETQCMN